MVAIDGYGLSCKFADVALVKETKVLFIDSWPPPVCIFLEFLITCCINFCQAKVEKPSTIDADNSSCDTKTEDLIDEWWMMNMSFFHFLNIYFLFFGNVASDRLNWGAQGCSEWRLAARTFGRIPKPGANVYCQVTWKFTTLLIIC